MEEELHESDEAECETMLTAHGMYQTFVNKNMRGRYGFLLPDVESLSKKDMDALEAAAQALRAIYDQY